MFLKTDFAIDLEPTLETLLEKLEGEKYLTAPPQSTLRVNIKTHLLVYYIGSHQCSDEEFL